MSLSVSVDCDYCMTSVAAVIHCMDDRRKGGCHDSFEDSEAYWAHIHHKTGGCMSPGNYPNFYRSDGVWKLKKKDESTLDHSHS